jgi:hypothetical protein
MTTFHGIFPILKLNMGNIKTFRGILSIPHNIVMDMNNVMTWEKDGIGIIKNPSYSHFPPHETDMATYI